MLDNASEKVKTLVLLRFTEKLINWSSPTLFLEKLEKRAEESERNKKQERTEKVKEAIKSAMPILEEAKIEPLTKPKFLRPQFSGVTVKPTLRVPESRLPPQFSYLKPIASTHIEIDLGKLNPLLRDNAVKIIECNGENQQVIVRGAMGTKPTEIRLTKDEINKIIQTFSEKSKIPIGKGPVRIALGKHIFSAIISDEFTKFTIEKIPQIQPIQKIMPRR